MMVENEVYQAIVGGKFGKLWWGRGLDCSNTEGTPGSVAFDPQIVVDREDNEGDFVGFWHTHPSFPAAPSSTDYQTMGAWTLSLGRPLLCLIEGTDGLKAHWFINDETRHKTGWVKKIGDLYIGIIP